MSYFKLYISSLLIVICLAGCASTQKTLNEKSDQVYIKKLEVGLNNKKLPRQINIFYFAPNSEDLIEGISSNYYYYKRYAQYKPQLNFINLSDKNHDCLNLQEKKSFSITFVGKKSILDIKSNCLSIIQSSNSLVINHSGRSVNQFKGSKIFNIYRDQDLQKMLLHAKQKGSLRTLVIDDDTTKDGKKITDLWTKLGGTVVARKSSLESSQNQELISKILSIEKSVTRNRKLSRVIGIKTEHQPRKRTDVDSIILSTTLENARSLKPALEYNFANLLSVYLIPSWAEQENLSIKELDLERITIVDSPLMLNQTVKPLGLEGVKRSREFSMGYDAYELVLLLNTSNNFRYKGMSGLITKEGSSFKRESYITTFDKGRLEPLKNLN
jgi:hypothetical protein